MSDETWNDGSRGPDRTRIALIAILVLLLLLLAGMTWALLRVLTPIGAPDSTGAQRLPAGLTWVRSIYGWGSAEDQQFRAPTDVAVAPDGTIWGTDPQRARVLAFNPDGTFKTMIMRGPSGAMGPGRLLRPEGVATDDEGTVYIADYGGGKVAVYTPENQLVREIEVPFPLDVAVTRDRMYVSAVSGVAVFTRDGKFLTLWGRRGNGPDDFDTARGIGVGPDGTVYVSDTNNARVKAYTPDGDLKWVYPAERRTAKRPGVSNRVKTVLELPSALSIDGAGRIVLVDPFKFEMVVLDPTKGDKDRLVGVYGGQGSRDGLFTYPTGIAYDGARDWFVIADTSNDRLQIMRVGGSASNPITPAIARAFAGPWWLCAIPLALLGLGIAIAVARYLAMRRARDEDELRASEDELPSTPPLEAEESSEHGFDAETVADEGDGWYASDAVDDPVNQDV